MRVIDRSWAFWLYIVGLAAVYVITVVHTHIILIPHLPHDDGLFMSLGRSIAEGKWLGPFSQFTLMKGPGYPAFLAAANWLGISVSLAHALFHCLAAITFVVVVRKFIGSMWISAILYTLLLWHPISLSAHMRRILRDEIYYGQVVIILAVAAAIFCSSYGRGRLMILAGSAGAFFGWFWLTREEGVWLLPGLGIIAGAGLYCRFRQGRTKELVLPVLIMVTAFGLVQGGFGLGNRLVYGTFVGVDVKERNFVAALRAINSVRSGGTKRFVSVTGEGRRRIYAVSPAFASLSSYFEGPGGEGWRFGVCKSRPVSCDDFAAGWFQWALRDGVSATGRYSSPAAASALFGQIANEINAACARGALECVPQLIAEMPPVTLMETVTRMAPRYVDALKLLLLWDPPLQLGASGAADDAFAVSLRFLNYPLHTPSNEERAPLTTSVFLGWYYQAPSPSWFSVSGRSSNGSAAEVWWQRLASPDIRDNFKDPAASNQRFAIRVQCVEPCSLTFETSDGKVERPIASLLAGLGFDVGTGHVHLDNADTVPKRVYVPTLAETLCGRLREAVLKNYQFVFVPILALGAIAFLAATAIYRAACWRNACYVVAAACWMLVFLRASLLILIDVTAFPALFGFYLAPAYFLLVAAAITSCCAWLQLSERLAAPMVLSPGRLGDAA